MCSQGSHEHAKKGVSGLRYAATFHSEVEGLVRMEEVSEKCKNKPKWLFAFRKRRSANVEWSERFKGENRL